MKILLNSTSFLLPNNESWKFLKKNNGVFFSDYANINNNENIRDKIDLEIALFFLPDLFDYFQSYKLNHNEELKKISNIIKLIQQKLRSKNKKFIIGVSEHLYNNVINFSKKYNLSKKIKNYFLDELYKLTKQYRF